VADSSTRASGLDLDDAALRSLFDESLALAGRELAATREGPVFAEAPTIKAVNAAIDGGAPLPRHGATADRVLAAAEHALRLGRRSSPTFFGYIFSPATAPAVVGDLLASAADQNVTSWRSAPAATAIERQTINWVSQFVGYGDAAAGLFVSGGSLANLTALLIALRARTPHDADRRGLCVYSSEEAHFSIGKAAAAIGVQSQRVAVDAAFRLEIDDLRAAIGRDRAAGLTPFCIVGSAGTTATGAVDPLAQIADVARQESTWFHIDGAYGAPAAATQVAASEFDGMADADSVSVDAHKWLYVPVDCSALLVRDPAASYGAFGPADDYVRVLAGESEESFAFWDHGLELSRRSRALKLWLTFRFYGADRLAQAIEEDIELARLMADFVRETDDLELLCEPSLSVCCFRHRPRGFDEEALAAHNDALLAQLQRDGRAYFSNVSVAGRSGLRACITNFRTTAADVRRAIDLVRELGNRVCGPRRY
jgi:aromatic-L-amino-acid decarboxylase